MSSYKSCHKDFKALAGLLDNFALHTSANLFSNLSVNLPDAHFSCTSEFFNTGNNMPWCAGSIWSRKLTKPMPR